MKVAILGGGPGALFAYYACLDLGFPNITLFSEKLTYPVGAFWLYELPYPIPGIEPRDIDMGLEGSAAVYTQKQWDHPYRSSAQKWANGGTVKGYDPVLLHILYQQAKKYHTKSPLTQADIDGMSRQYDYVIQTFPTDPYVKAYNEVFRFPVYFADIPHNYANYCTYNGTWRDDWTRMTMAFHRVSVEYPASYKNMASAIKAQNDEAFATRGTVAMMPDLHPEVQPITETVVGPMQNVLLTGRWTTLNRSHLAHDTREDVLKFFRKLGYGQASQNESPAQQSEVYA